MEWLVNCYTKTGEEWYLEVVERIECICNVMTDKKCQVVYLQNDKNEIRRVLRHWPKAIKKEDSPEWVACDIMNRVENKIKGTKYYKRGNNSQAFEVVVSENRSFLFDLERRVIYCLCTKA